MNTLAVRPKRHELITGMTAQKVSDRVGGVGGQDGHDYVKFEPHFLWPTEVDKLIGDTAKAKDKLC